MTFNDWLVKLVDQAPLIVVVVIVVWLSLPQLAERFSIIGKLVKPISKKWREKAARLEEQRRAEALVEARKLASAAMREMTPPDVKEMEIRMRRIDGRLSQVQDAEELLRAFVIYDELWHFKDDHNEARRGRLPQQRLTFDVFEERWNKGWRPFNDKGEFDFTTQGPTPPMI